MISKVALFYSDRVCVRVIAADEFFFVTAVRSNRASCQAKYALCNTFFVNLLALFDVRKISVNLMNYAVLVEICAADEKRILKVNLVLLVV